MSARAAALDAVEGKTVPFDTLDDSFDLNAVLPAEPQSWEKTSDTAVEKPKKIRLFGIDEPEEGEEELFSTDVMPEENLLSDYESPDDREAG